MSEKKDGFEVIRLAKGVVDIQCPEPRKAWDRIALLELKLAAAENRFEAAQQSLNRVEDWLEYAYKSQTPSELRTYILRIIERTYE